MIVLGLGVFYQQELTNVAREAARYAAIHSATAQCPTVSNLVPGPSARTYYAMRPARGPVATDDRLRPTEGIRTAARRRPPLRVLVRVLV